MRVTWTERSVLVVFGVSVNRWLGELCNVLYIL